MVWLTGQPLQGFYLYYRSLTHGVLIFASTEASHKKLLQNAEKTVGAQLSDAETKIAEVQKVSQCNF